MSPVLGLRRALLAAGLLAGAMLPAHADDVYGRYGYWMVYQRGSGCDMATHVGHVTLGVMRVPDGTPVMAVVDPALAIPNGTYPVAVDWAGFLVPLQHREVQARGVGQVIVVRFTTPADLGALLSAGWLTITAGARHYHFNTDAADALRMLAVCEDALRSGQRATDPFAPREVRP